MATSEAKTFRCVDIREVWDFRLSIGSPILYNNGETWIAKIWANDPGDEDCKSLKEYDTGIKTNGDNFDNEAITACFEWLYSIRDEFSRDHIELRKPVVKLINDLNDKAGFINAEAVAAKEAKDTKLFNAKNAELQNHLTKSNALIKKAADDLHTKIASIEEGEA